MLNYIALHCTQKMSTVTSLFKIDLEAVAM